MSTGQNYTDNEMVDRRRSPDFSQITGYIPKPLATDFRVACTRLEVAQSDVIEELIRKWLQELENQQNVQEKSA